MIDRRFLEDAARRSKPAGLPILTDRPCDKCKYNLKGLSASAVCPECGTPITGSREKEWKDPFPDDPRRARDKQAGLMAFDRVDLVRLARGTTMQSLGLTLVSLGLFVYNLMILCDTYFGFDLAETFVLFALGGLASFGGLLWFFGGFFTLAKRKGGLDIRRFHRAPVGALGVVLSKIQRKSLSEAHAVGPGDYLSGGARRAIQWAQLLLPIASGLTAAFFATNGWDVKVFSAWHSPGDDPFLTVSQLAWGAAVIGMLPMVMFLFDLARTASDDFALNNISMSLWCVIIGCFSMLVVLLVTPLLGLIGGPIGVVAGLLAYLVYPGGLLLPLGLLGLAKSCRWAPKLQAMKFERDGGRLAPKITSHGMDGKSRKCEQCGFDLVGRKYGCRCPECNYQESE